MKKGDFVKVKKGIKDPEHQQFDMSGWKGLISEKFDSEKGEPIIIQIQWDIETLKKIPPNYIKKCIEDGCEFEAMNLEDKEVIVLESKNKDNQKEREQLIIDLDDKFGDADFDDDDLRLSEILENNDISVNAHNLTKFRTFLIEHLKGRVLLTGIEDFPWEERFVFGYGSEREYAQLRKTNPSYKDTFKLVKILSVDDGDRDLVAKVQRQSDRRTFQIPLSRLECVDQESDNYALLDEFSVWVVNY